MMDSYGNLVRERKAASGKRVVGVFGSAQVQGQAKKAGAVAD